jgi:hypothetical protein
VLRYGGSQVVVINVPWYLEEPRIEQGLDEEELGIEVSKNRPGRPRRRSVER